VPEVTENCSDLLAAEPGPELVPASPELALLRPIPALQALVTPLVLLLAESRDLVTADLSLVVVAVVAGLPGQASSALDLCLLLGGVFVLLEPLVHSLDTPAPVAGVLLVSLTTLLFETVADIGLVTPKSLDFGGIELATAGLAGGFTTDLLAITCDLLGLTLGGTALEVGLVTLVSTCSLRPSDFLFLVLVIWNAGFTATDLELGSPPTAEIGALHFTDLLETVEVVTDDFPAMGLSTVLENSFFAQPTLENTEATDFSNSVLPAPAWDLLLVSAALARWTLDVEGVATLLEFVLTDLLAVTLGFIFMTFAARVALICFTFAGLFSVAG